MSAARDRFHSAILAKNDTNAVVQLNGLSMDEMLPALAAIGQDQRTRLTSALLAAAGRLNVSRMVYALQVVNDMTVPAAAPGDLETSGQAQTARNFVALPDFKQMIFRTADEAAKSVLNAINPSSIQQNREYWGLIRQTAASFSATAPLRSPDETGATPVLTPGVGFKDVAIYHTHGAGYKFVNGSTAAESFSGDDRILCVMKFYVDGYLATPSSNLLHVVKPSTRPDPNHLAFGTVVTMR